MGESYDVAEASAEILELSRRGDRGSIGALLEYSRHGDELIRMSAYHALATVSTGVPAEMLLLGAEDVSSRVRLAALRALCVHDPVAAANIAAEMCARDGDLYHPTLVLRDYGDSAHLPCLLSIELDTNPVRAEHAATARQAIERRAGLSTAEAIRGHSLASLPMSPHCLKQLRRKGISTIGELAALGSIGSKSLGLSESVAAEAEAHASTWSKLARPAPNAIPAPQPIPASTAELAIRLLRSALQDPTAEFRGSQLEAIEALVDQQARLLVVQRTGWGKSMVYFIATAILRDRGRGTTLIVSPLLSLMRNQLTAAGRLGLVAETINCENKDAHEDIIERLSRDAIDMLLIAPERFANRAFREDVLASLGQRVGMLVVDEAHCISDWGHDFRPDYRRIARVLQAMPPNLPVLATTATANNRVVADDLEQIGQHTRVVRGSLRRDTLRLQNLEMPHYAARLAWLAERIPELPGSGIVYVLTKRDADRVTAWLCSRGIDALAYYSGLADRGELEAMLIENRVKVLVATVALGMGFDKPDLGFVIHFQRPGSVVHYYQQVGRAGRGIPEAIGVLLAGKEDDDIADYFIRTALPPATLMKRIVDSIREAAVDGLSVPMLAARCNVARSKIDQAMALLETECPSPVAKDGTRWFPTPVDWTYDADKSERLMALRREEQSRMQEYVKTSECLQVFLARELDADDLQPCGKCANCLNTPILPVGFSEDLATAAAEYLNHLELPIRARKRWPGDALVSSYGWSGAIDSGLLCEQGCAVCRWGDPGWGQLVQRGKQEGGFDDRLVTASAQLIAERWAPRPAPTWVTCIPSLRHGSLVPDFAKRLAGALRIPYSPCLTKARETRPQKTMQNSWNQANNLAGSFSIDSALVRIGPVLLVDDVVDSKWTFTIAGALLRDHGTPAVFPFALADTSQSGA